MFKQFDNSLESNHTSLEKITTWLKEKLEQEDMEHEIPPLYTADVEEVKTELQTPTRTI